MSIIHNKMQPDLFFVFNMATWKICSSWISDVKINCLNKLWCAPQVLVAERNTLPMAFNTSSCVQTGFEAILLIKES